MTAKNLILLLDGTWNDVDFGNADTNIVRLQERISAQLLSQPSSPTDVGAGIQSGEVQGRKSVVFYQRGVGTNAIDRISGGAFGAGLNQIVRNAYRFICANYAKGDDIFVFGFSRGAFTARSLAGYVAAAGILKREKCTAANESRAWYYYRNRPAERLSGIANEIAPDIHQGIENPITCLGIFDTVGSLGAPFRRFSKFNRSLYEFHDVYLSTVSKVNLHALAIDEHRWPFEATLWRRSKFVPLANRTEQVWFAGSHSDVGGGNIDESCRSQPSSELDDIALDWMLRRINAMPETAGIFPAPVMGVDPEGAVLADQVEARSGAYLLYPFAHRSIGDVPVDQKFWHSTVGRDRHNRAQNEAVHISAIERLGRVVRINGRSSTYIPENLVTYLVQQTRRSRPLVPIIDWSGDPLDASAAAVAVEHALTRLKV